MVCCVEVILWSVVVILWYVVVVLWSVVVILWSWGRRYRRRPIL